MALTKINGELIARGAGLVRPAREVGAVLRTGTPATGGSSHFAINLERAPRHNLGAEFLMHAPSCRRAHRGAPRRIVEQRAQRRRPRRRGARRPGPTSQL